MGFRNPGPNATPPKDSPWLCLWGRNRSERKNHLHYNSQLKGLEEEEGQKNNCLTYCDPPARDPSPKLRSEGTHRATQGNGRVRVSPCRAQGSPLLLPLFSTELKGPASFSRTLPPPSDAKVKAPPPTQVSVSSRGSFNPGVWGKDQQSLSNPGPMCGCLQTSS